MLRVGERMEAAASMLKSPHRLRFSDCIMQNSALLFKRREAIYMS